MTYNAILDKYIHQLEREAEQGEEYLPFKEVEGHRKNGTTWAILLKWEDDSESWEPLLGIYKDDLIFYAC